MRAYVREALDVLSANRVRTGLTTLSLTVAVATVILIQTLGAGLAGALGGMLGSISDRSFIVLPAAQQANLARAALHVRDLDALRALPNITAAMPAGAIVRLIQVGHHRVRLAVTSDGDQRFCTTPIAAGRAFDAGDIDAAAHVAELTSKAARRLFPDTHAVGRSIRIGERSYVVVGVTAEPKTGMLPDILHADVTIPWSTYQREFLADGSMLAARFLVGDGRSIAQTESAVLELLRARKGERVAYRTFDRQGAAKTIDGISLGETLVVELIGALSLVVAGIGILNIMLVSVAERRREIGIRKAIGATHGQVLTQFFVEALLLSGFGCAIGLFIGLGIGSLFNAFALVQISGIVTPIPWMQAVVAAIGFTTLLVVFFGTYPAHCAARLDPIEALRHE